MIKMIGWIMTAIGAVVSFVNATTYMETSQEIQAWYYHRSELEACQTYLAIGLVMTVLGIAILLSYYQKSKK